MIHGVCWGSVFSADGAAGRRQAGCGGADPAEGCSRAWGGAEPEEEAVNNKEGEERRGQE